MNDEVRTLPTDTIKQTEIIVENKKPDLFANFQSLDIRIGEIISAEDIPNADKLLKLTVNFGELGNKTILSGIKEYITKESLLNKRYAFIINFPPRKMKGIESGGMILAAKDETLHILGCDAKPGSKVG